MPDLRLTHGEDYYRNIRKKRVTPSKGNIQNLTEEEKKTLSKKGHEARWSKKRDEKDIWKKEKSNTN